MSNTNKRIIIFIIVVLSIIVSNLIGGFIGFDKGYEARLFHEGMDVIQTVSMLERLQDGKTEYPIKMLETKLDWQIYNFGSYKSSIDSIYNFNKYNSDIDEKELAGKTMIHAIKYRRTHPSDFPDEEFQNTISSIMNKYEKVSSN